MPIWQMDSQIGPYNTIKASLKKNQRKNQQSEKLL